MKCEKCGANLMPGDMFCQSCGAPVQNVNAEYGQGNNMENGGSTGNGNMYNNVKPNMNNTRPVNSQKKSSNTGDIAKIIIAIIIAAVVVFALLLGAGVILEAIKGAKQPQNSQVVGDSQINNGGTGSVNNSNKGGNTDNTGNVSQVSNNKTSTYKVKYKGFNIYIPDNLLYEMDYTNDAINVGNEEQTWFTQINIQQSSYQAIKNNKSKIKANMIQAVSSYATNPNVSDAKVENIGGREYIILEIEAGGTKFITGCTELNSMNTACFELYNDDNSFDRNEVKNLSTIFSSVEYTGDSTYMKANDNMKVKDFSAAIEKAIK